MRVPGRGTGIGRGRPSATAGGSATGSQAPETISCSPCSICMDHRRALDQPGWMDGLGSRPGWMDGLGSRPGWGTRYAPSSHRRVGRLWHTWRSGLRCVPCWLAHSVHSPASSARRTCAPNLEARVSAS
eukprot:335694-Hanusia_phi.AAC.14